MHLCFEVDDVFASAARLRAQGVEMLEGPNKVEAGPLAGFNWIYFRAPWGLLLEVASFDKLGYEKDSPHRLWRAKQKAADRRAEPGRRQWISLEASKAALRAAMEKRSDRHRSRMSFSRRLTISIAAGSPATQAAGMTTAPWTSA